MLSAPRIYEIACIAQLEREVFGPILHVVRYTSGDIDEVIDAINALGYGLTLDIHSWIEAFPCRLHKRLRVGKTYANRNIIGAVVGVQPFGGERLSDNTAAIGGNASLFAGRSP